MKVACPYCNGKKYIPNNGKIHECDNCEDDGTITVFSFNELSVKEIEDMIVYFKYASSVSLEELRKSDSLLEGKKLWVDALESEPTVLAMVHHIQDLLWLHFDKTSETK